MPSSSTEQSLSVITGGSPEGVTDDLVGSVQRYVDAVVAPLREQILVQQVEIEALKARPSPQIDGFIDRTGMLVLTRGDGTVREAGIVVGRDGKDGATIDDFEAMLAPIKAELANARRPEPQPGRDGQPGLPGAMARREGRRRWVGFRRFASDLRRRAQVHVSVCPGREGQGVRLHRPHGDLSRGCSRKEPHTSPATRSRSVASIWHCLEPYHRQAGPRQSKMAPRLQAWPRRQGRTVGVSGRRRRRLQGQRKRLAEDVERSTWTARQRPAASVMMTDDVDELLREAEAKFDRTIIELAVEEGNRLLAAGATADDLPRLMAPFVEVVRQWRADAMAEMHAHVRRIRLVEARIGLNEELIRRNEACIACLERLGATVH